MERARSPPRGPFMIYRYRIAMLYECLYKQQTKLSDQFSIYYNLLLVDN